MEIVIEEKVIIILSKILEIEKEHVKNAKRGLSPEWDSMAWVSIIASLEEEFEIELSENDYEKVASFDLIVEIIKEKLHVDP